MEIKRLKTGRECVHCRKWTDFAIRSTFWLPLCEDCQRILIDARAIRKAMDERRTLLYREKHPKTSVFFF